jgi:type IV pilus assembly protein PilN
MVKINLLPPEERIDRNKVALERVKDNAHYLLAITAMLIFALFGGIQELSIRSARAEVSELEAESNAILPQLAKVQKIEAEKTELSRRLDVIKGLDRGRLLRVRMLDAVNKRVPEYMWLTAIEENSPGAVSIEGVTFSNLVVAEFMNRLEASVLFNNVDLEVAQRGTIEDQHVVQFVLNSAVQDDQSVPIITDTEE